MITSQHPPRIVIQTLKRSWNGRGRLTGAFSSSLTTTVFSQRSMRRLGASLRRAAPKGHETFISRTAPHQEPVPTSGPPCVQDTLRHPQGWSGPGAAQALARTLDNSARVEPEVGSRASSQDTSLSPWLSDKPNPLYESHNDGMADLVRTAQAARAGPPRRNGSASGS